MARSKANQPAVRKGVSFPFQVSIAAWIDLLGYGEMVSAAGFNPLDPQAEQALTRLRKFHSIVATHSARTFPTLVMNDGAVAYRDLSLRSSSVTSDFFTRAWALFQAIKSSEEVEGYPGPRMVVACGFRMRGSRAGQEEASGHFASILERLHDRRIDFQEALREAANIRRFSDIVPQLQANFAFTKAYLAEQAGAKGGFAGSQCFVDLAIFKATPEWVVLSKPFDWHHHKLNLQAHFAAVSSVLETRRTEGVPPELRTGLQIAAHLTSDPQILSTLRTAKKP